MTSLTRIRPSNLVILAFLPFAIYLFTMVPNYRRSFISIVGIEDGGFALLVQFVFVVVMLVAGLVWPFLALKGLDQTPRWRAFSIFALALNLFLAACAAKSGFLTTLISSIVANHVDPTQSELVVRAVTPRRLTPEGATFVAAEAATWLWRHAMASAALVLPSIGFLATGANSVVRRWLMRAVFAFNGVILAYVLLAAHAGFASGLFTTLRAGIFAYILAALLGLLWAGLLRVTLKKRTLKIATALSLLCLAASVVMFMQPRTTFVLAGSLDKSVAISRGTPKALVDTIRFGRFDETLNRELKMRSTTSPDHALKLLAEGQEVSAVFMPPENVPAGLPELWRTSFLRDSIQTPAFFLLVGGILMGLLSFSAFQHQRHPLAVAAEFFIDTVRGIPMLVIILFVGLPFSGAIKDASSGAIDMPNVLRGVIAMALGYSAYLAEIFRAGIDAVPKGQIEASRTLGLSSWQLARLVVLPQAFKIVIPALGNEFIAILKDTSLLSILSVRDVTQRMREFQSASFLPFAPFNTAAIIYVFLTLAAASLIASIERKYDVKHR